MPAAVPAIPANPNRAASNAMIRKLNDQFNITTSFAIFKARPLPHSVLSSSATIFVDCLPDILLGFANAFQHPPRLLLLFAIPFGPIIPNQVAVLLLEFPLGDFPITHNPEFVHLTVFR
jgi:hypothetical protein